MTNEIEDIIIKQNKESKQLTLSETRTYLLYKEIWKFILYAQHYNYNTLTINFIIKTNTSTLGNINYEISGNDIHYKTVNYYEGCNKLPIKLLLNYSIDYKLLFKLFNLDEFHCDCFECDDKLIVYIETNKYNINKIIDHT